jgi:hypothetical protein
MKSKKGWRVEAFTIMGVIPYEPIHHTRGEAEKHKIQLENENKGISFGIIREENREVRNKECGLKG